MPKSAQKVPENLAKIGKKQCFGRARKINLVDLKINRQIFGKFFENTPPPPLEKILDPPLGEGEGFFLCYWPPSPPLGAWGEREGNFLYWLLSSPW